MKILVPLSIVLAAACASTPPAAEHIPARLIPPGYTEADCHIEKPATVDTVPGPNGVPVTAGERDPEVRCEHHESAPGAIKVIPTCKTRSGKDLPLSDCCMTDSGEPIPNCTMKLQPPGE